jgi:anti-anti-sigma factor
MSDVIAAEMAADVAGAPCVVLAGDIDLAVVPRVRRCLEEARRRSPGRIRIDVSRVAFVDSSGLGTLAQASLGEAVVELSGTSAMFRRLLDTVGLTELFVLVDPR